MGRHNQMNCDKCIFICTEEELHREHIRGMKRAVDHAEQYLMAHARKTGDARQWFLVSRKTLRQLREAVIGDL